ncbi:Thiol-disulfide isomerase or thioredoxin [Solimonas aquatica]|uniref:Thiol-disulfide isomerase or thioredoxin n=1 Tax=Solimonas aquatica TaxID=489703 RepID=A0A1H9GF04_9GAMM|nr:TlpA disulfide reductase family protein [Solimonas aquatica]SEQ48623.1 Thiol-disulfide isomerase or thioredoxin [Solimonas aquatica]
MRRPAPHGLIAALLLAISAILPAQAAELPTALSAYKGKIIYLDFWASWCAPCAQSFPWLNALKSRFGDRLTVLAVNVDEHQADAQRFLEKHPAQFALAYDPKGALADHYQIAGMPSALILGADGRVLHQHSGFREEEIPQYESAITAALGKTP